MEPEKLIKLLNETLDEIIEALECDEDEVEKEITESIKIPDSKTNDGPKGVEDFKKPENLKDTIPLMLSLDYKKRFIGEYYQLKIRYEKLKAFCDKIEAAKLFDMPEPPHDIPLTMLRGQQETMGHYLHILEVRAIKEGISL